MAPIDFSFTINNEFMDTSCSLLASNMEHLFKLLNGRSSSTPSVQSTELGSPYSGNTYSKLSSDSTSTDMSDMSLFMKAREYGSYDKGSTGSPSSKSDVDRSFGAYPKGSSGGSEVPSEDEDDVFSPYEGNSDESNEYFQDNDNDSFCDEVLNEIMFSPSNEVDVMHQKFFEDSLFRNDFNEHQSLNLPQQQQQTTTENNNQQLITSPQPHTDLIQQLQDRKEVISTELPTSNNNDNIHLSTSRDSRRIQQKVSNISKPKSTKQTSGKKSKRRRRKNLLKPGSQLYQFILQLLDDDSKRELIRWEKPRNMGIFRIVNKEKVSQLWGDARNRTMTYDSLSRGLRHYYSQGLLSAVNKKLHYQFTQKALDEWEIIRDKDLIEER